MQSTETAEAMVNVLIDALQLYKKQSPSRDLPVVTGTGFNHEGA